EISSRGAPSSRRAAHLRVASRRSTAQAPRRGSARSRSGVGRRAWAADWCRIESCSAQAARATPEVSGIVLDAGALIALERNERALWAALKVAALADEEVLVPSA